MNRHLQMVRLVAFCLLFLCGVGRVPVRAAAPSPEGPGLQNNQKASTPMPTRRAYARADLPQLKALDRQGVFTALGSFDARDLTEEQFAWQAVALLDAGRIPGLAAARAADDLPGALAAVMAACRQKPAQAKPELTPAARALADDALAHRFTFYGETHQLPAEIDWEFNPGTAHWGHDLNRFTYLTPLTTAYLATGDARYSRKAVGLILDWIARCDFARSFAIEQYAFGSYLNLAIHAGAWSRSLEVLVDHGQVEPLELLRILKSLHDHLAYLEIVTRGDEGNWPTIGCMGMLATLEHFPVLRDTGRFAAYCRDELATLIADQVLPDGVQDELTPHYHQVVVNNLTNACRSLRALGMDLAPDTLDTLRKMVQYSQQTLTPDGSKQVSFNDSDPAAVPNLPRQMAALGLEAFLRPADQLGPAVYPYAGVAFLRQRQDQGDLYLAFDAGPFGRSHQHEDKLGCWLFAYGRNLLVDPGRHLYDQSAASYYAYLTSTRAHSTILVDGQGQHSRGRRETWVAKQPLDLGWQVTPGEQRAYGVYDLGYGPKNAIAVTHRREIVFVRERCWVVFDVLEGAGEHDIMSRFQFAPGKLVLEDTRAHTAFPDANLLLWPVSTQPITKLACEEGQQNPRGGWYSDSYNKIEPAPALAVHLRAPLPLRMATLLFPYRGAELPAVHFTFTGNTATLRTPELGEITINTRL
ncbi:MAG: alginate lyase family protein [Armatimonadota bacterium]